MRRCLITILLVLSVQLSLLGGVAWALSYWRPATITGSVDAASSVQRSATFLENRRGRIVYLTQWAALTTRGSGDYRLWADCGIPRMVVLFSLDGSSETSMPSFTDRRIPDPRDADSLWARAGFSFDGLTPRPWPGPSDLQNTKPRQLLDPPAYDSLPRGPVVGHRQVMIPHWFIVAAGVPIPAWSALRNLRSRRRLRRGLCLGCGYDIRESHSRCPECGLAVGH